DLPQAPDVPYVVTEPGALTAVNDTVEVTVRAQDASTPVVLAMGRADDVAAWVGDSPHWVVTGLSDWEHLSHTVAEGEPAPTATPRTAPSPRPMSPNPRRSTRPGRTWGSTRSTARGSCTTPGPRCPDAGRCSWRATAPPPHPRSS